MRTLNDREKRLVRFGGIGLALYLAGTESGAREGLDAEGVATAVQPLSDGAAANPPLAQPTRF